jgi:hypothetical protein
MNMEDPIATLAGFKADSPATDHIVTDSIDALTELYRLLNDYAPLWYKKCHRQKAEDVLRKLGRL